MIKGFAGGAISAVILLLGGWLIWAGQSKSSTASAAQSLVGAPAPEPLTLPEGATGLRGKAPPGLPSPPEAGPKSREEKRFNRYDKDRNEVISRIEMMASRSKDFKKLDTDNNNLLSFEEWAIKTSDKFAGADGDKNGKLTRSEFATTAPKPKAKPSCAC